MYPQPRAFSRISSANKHEENRRNVRSQKQQEYLSYIIKGVFDPPNKLDIVQRDRRLRAHPSEYPIRLRV
jgi:hypothetical protein